MMQSMLLTTVIYLQPIAVPEVQTAMSHKVSSIHVRDGTLNSLNGRVSLLDYLCVYIPVLWVVVQPVSSATSCMQ